MIVPSRALIAATAVVGIPACALAGLVPGTGLFAAACVLALVAAAAVDVALSLQYAVDWQVSCGPVVRMTRFGEGPVTVNVTRPPSASSCRVRVGLPLPSGVVCRARIADTRMAPNQATVAVTFVCTASRRGVTMLPPVHVEVGSALGLFCIRRRSDSRGELHVYPDLQREYRRLAPFFLNRGMGGAHVYRLLGKGREFEKLREYVHGDSFEDIHWKATAKRRRPITKVYQVERTQQVYVAVDCSRLSGRTVVEGAGVKEDNGVTKSEPISHLDRFVDAGLLLGSAAHRQGDLYGLALFSADVQRLVKASRGPSHYSVYRDTLLTCAPDNHSPGFRDLCARLRVSVPRRALVILLTCLDDPVVAEELVDAVSLIQRQHLVVVGTVQPPGTHPLFARTVGSSHEVYRHLAEHMSWVGTSQLERTLAHGGVRLVRMDQQDICQRLVATYVHIKSRQLV